MIDFRKVMPLRILINPAVLALALLAACGGSDSSSPTPSVTASPTPSPTPEPVTCTAANLYGALVGAESLGDAQFLTVGITNVGEGCFFQGAPAINWYDTAGTKLEIPEATIASSCQPQAGDFTTCVYQGKVTLPAGAPTPSADVSGQATAIIGVNQSDASAECPLVGVGHSVELAFTGITPNLRIDLPADVTLDGCTTVTLQGYGPLPTPQE